MKKALTVIACGVLVAGCQTINPYTGQAQTGKAATGAGIGAVAGAVLGAAVSSKKDRGRGALTGLLVGGAVGGGIGYYMDQQEALLRQELAATGVSVERVGENEIRLIMPGNITFATNSDQLEAGFSNTLSGVVMVLRKFDRSLLEVAGFTDSVGSFEHNQLLSERRARTVANYLLSNGVAGARIESQGYGERYPLADNKSKAGRALNRRVELNIRGQQ